MASDSRDVLARIDAEKETYLEELKDYIRIPSISTDPAYKAEVQRAASWTAVSVIRSRAAFSGTVGGRMACTKNPASSS